MEASSRMEYETGKETRLRGNVWKYSTGYGLTTPDKYAHEHPAMFLNRSPKTISPHGQTLAKSCSTLSMGAGQPQRRQKNLADCG